MLDRRHSAVFQSDLPLVLVPPLSKKRPSKSSLSIVTRDLTCRTIGKTLILI